MKDRGRLKKMLPAGFGAMAAAILAISCYRVMIAGPLAPVLKERHTIYMLAEVSVVFLWNVLWLSGTGRRRLQAAGVLTGLFVFTWCHQIFLPVVVSGLYMILLTAIGRWALSLFLGDIYLPPAGEFSMGLVLGSALWMVVVCLVSMTGHGGLKLWRLIAAGLALLAGAGQLLRKKEATFRFTFQNIWLPRKKHEAWLLAFIITMVLLQAGRMNTELDYDSLHYGLRSAFVLDNGKGIYDNLGMINLVYTYSKGLEVLLLPLSGTPTYGFVLAFSLWASVGVLLLIYHMVSAFEGRERGLLAAALGAAVPGIMNMAATAKNDMVTLLHQLMIYYFLSQALTQDKKKDRIPWLLMAVSAYLLTMVYKPTALVFSTALGAAAVLCLVLTRRFTLGSPRGWLLLVLPAGAVTGLWYRTYQMTGVPVTSIFAGFFERLGFTVTYPFAFTHVIGDPRALNTGEKLARLASRIGEMLLAPVSEDMDHVIIAWGSGLITFLLFVWIVGAWRNKGREAVKALDFFDRMLIPSLGLVCVTSIFTLSQVDGNYFILFYALLIVSSLRMLDTGSEGGEGEAGLRSRGRVFGLKRKLYLILLPFLICSVPLTCATGWAGNPGFTQPRLKHKGYFDHRAAAEKRRALRGYSQLALCFTPRTRVLAFGKHPEVLELPCCVQSYYDVTGSGGNVYLVKKLAYFEDFLQYAGTEYFFVESGYLADQPRALQMIEDMIAEGSLRDLRYEWGNMVARVTLGGPAPKEPQQAVAQFHENYSMQGYR